MARHITTDELWNILRYEGSEFFSVEFERRTRSRRHNARPGTITKMLCRTGMNKYKLGIESNAQRDARDFQNCILTVWSCDAYNANIQRGMSKEQAAFNSWRTIDIATVRSCSLLDKLEIENAKLPPDIIAGVHRITNQFRLQNMPRAV